MFTSDNLKMFGRYGLAIAVSYATAKGMLTPVAADVLTQAIIELGGILFASLPAFYAAQKIDNAPKT